MLFSQLKQAYKMQTSDDEKLEILHYMISNSNGVSYEDFLSITPRSCQNYIFKEILTGSAFYASFKNYYFAEDSEGSKVYLLQKQSYLHQTKQQSTSYVYSKSYKYLMKHKVNIINLAKYNDSLNHLIIYEKDHNINEENPLHHEYFRISNLDLQSSEKIKRYLFTFTQDQGECKQLLLQEPFYKVQKYRFTNYQTKKFEQELAEFLNRFIQSLRFNFNPLYQLKQLIIGSRIIFQLNYQQFKPSLRMIIQSFSKSFFDHFLFCFTDFHEVMINYIINEFDYFTNRLLGESINRLSIMVQAYEKYYGRDELIKYDYKKNIVIKEFVEFYYMFDLLYLQIGQVNKMEQYAVIVDYYRTNQLQQYPNILISNVMQTIATLLKCPKQIQIIDPYRFITYNEPGNKLIFQYSNFLIQRHLYCQEYLWQLFLYDTFEQLREDKQLIDDPVYIQNTIKYINHNYHGKNRINEVEQYLIELLPDVPNKSLHDYILLVLTVLDPQTLLFNKLFGLIIYKYFSVSREKGIEIMEKLQNFLVEKVHQPLVLGILGQINYWKYIINNPNDQYVITWNSIEWKFKEIGLAYFRCGQYTESIYYLEQHIQKYQLLFQLEQKTLDLNQQKELYKIICYINEARASLNCGVDDKNIYKDLKFEFYQDQITLSDPELTMQQINWMLKTKLIPLTFEFYNYDELIEQKQHFNLIEPSRTQNIILQFIAYISKYFNKDLKSSQVDKYLVYLKKCLSLSLQTTIMTQQICINLAKVSGIIHRLESYWKAIKGQGLNFQFNKDYPQFYWLYLNTIVKRSNINCQIINYREDFAQYLVSIGQYNEALEICKKKQSKIKQKIHKKLGESYKVIEGIGIDPITYIQNKGQFITDPNECRKKLSFLKALIRDSIFYREKVLKTYDEIWNSKQQYPFIDYFTNKKKLSSFCFHYGTELEVEYQYKCDCGTFQSTCLKLFEMFLICISTGNKYVLQSFPKLFRIWFNHLKKETFPQKFDIILGHIGPEKLQFCLELLITGVETFKTDQASSKSISIALSILSQSYPSQMIWWLAPLKYFNTNSQHKVQMYEEVLKQSVKSRNKLIELEKQFLIILKICQQKLRSQQVQGWGIENISSQLLVEYNKNPEKIIYPGIDNLSLPFKQEDKLIKIIQIFSQMKIAPSKDKPKKIQLDCSDKNIRYLLLKSEVYDQKNSGDTRREQRIIQMLQFFNTILEPLELKYPLFASMSLNQMNQVIEWVENTKTCREVFGGPTVQAKNRAVYNKQEWDILMKKEPKFAEYFFSTYPDPYKWFDAQQNYIKSMALWSAFQYLIGFGDRHCDNILIHNNGELIHIDYECVFHKGKFLPVPEIVDFRLTKNFRYALGYLREQGQFKYFMQNILNEFQKNKEAISAFLDPYIYDPLLCKLSADVTKLIRQKLNSTVNVNDLIKRNRNNNILSMMYFGWAPYL